MEATLTDFEGSDEAPAPPASAPRMDARTRMLLEAPPLVVLLRLAWPNILVMMAHSATGLVELWYVAHLGVEALTAMALVTPVLILMQNMSQGAMGGGISSAIARALGAGQRDKADAFVFHSIVICAVFGLFFMLVILFAGRPLYRLLGGEGASLEAALTYSGIIFSGMLLIWIFSALASIIRGTGNMLVPGVVICGGLVLLIPLSPCLIFGFGPIPAMGIAGGGIALLIYYALGTLVLGWYVASGRNLARFRVVRLRWAPAREILAVGAVGAVNTLQINITIAGAMALVAAHSNAASVAGLGTGTRLEYLLPPLGFGLGAPLVALVGTNIGAGQGRRALRIALIGGALAFALTEAIGIAAAIWPEAWLRLFETDPEVLATGTAYLRTVGPFFGFFGLGITLYFACQGAGRLGWPLLGGLLRVMTVLGGGWIVLQLTGSLESFFAVYGIGLAAYGLTIAIPVARGSWFRR
ncbi:MATE family efflux transporter [Starkeya sp. ORNL1]|uniref:MATE family efflux transporter n=1 Tax=Starkeya sp. ORNL1 TaxID=2709380 RepID=UPI001FF06134|nr:MATE family efflux transporter [Starkeya sp. ORNL1]